MGWFDEIVRPMLAEKAEPFDSADHIFEIKWDGTRCISFIDVENKKLRLQNRRLLDITYRYPEFRFYDCFAKNCIVDGEIVVLRKGKPNFNLLQQREQVENRKKIQMLSSRIPATYVVFDILWINSKGWVIHLPLMERRKLLEDNLLENSLEERNLMLSEYIQEKGKAFFEKAIEVGFEGVIGKRKDSIYIPGKRTSLWLKIKKKNTIDAAILGLMKGEGGREDFFGSLVLGLFDGRKYVYVGRVGTGFDISFLEWFSEAAKPFFTEKVPFDEEPSIKREVQWLKPNFVAEVEFLEVSKDLKLRAPVFKRLRFDKKPEECLLDQIMDSDT
ncbi:MAG: DNA ligase [Archaeoglobus sp.]|nr:DNA ligase [Archaeoglobus sp.]